MNKDSKFKKELFQWVFSIGVAFLLTFTLRTYVISAADVDGSSMLPTLNDKDKIFVEKLSLFSNHYSKGEIVIFDSKNEKNDIYVKRVIAVAGDTIEIKDGHVYLNGSKLSEPYLKSNTATTGGSFLGENQKITINKGFIFVLGDNRAISLDSRYIGPINVKDIKGHVVLRSFPFNNIKTF